MQPRMYPARFGPRSGGRSAPDEGPDRRGSSAPGCKVCLRPYKARRAARLFDPSHLLYNNRRGCSVGKTAGRILLGLFGLAAAFAQIQHQVSVVNIAVPVRVYDGAKFVDTLGLDDFEVREDGKPQTVEAVYLIRGGALKRQEGAPGAAPPETRRNFVLLFQLSEYMPEIDRAIDLFFADVCRPGDAVDIVTPLRTLRLHNRVDTPDKVRKAQTEVKAKLKNDALIISGSYRSIIEDMIGHLGGGDPEYAEINLNGYRTDLDRLEELRTIDSNKLAAFAADLKARQGSKHAFLFYQREQVPKFNDRRLLEFLNGANQEETLKAMELLAVYNHDIRVDQDAIRRAFSDAEADVHFLYVTRNRRDPQRDVDNAVPSEDIRMSESSSDIYRVFKEIAAATGGTAAASANPAALLRAAADASEEYYLLYYRPQDFRADGKFHRIDVAVKRGGLRVTHREGYVAEDAGDAGTAQKTGAEQAQRRIADSAAEALGGVEDIDLAEPLPSKGAPVPPSVLATAAAYCRDLETASLDFVCRETVRERIGASFISQPAIIGRGVVAQSRERVRDWTYDYQLVRREGWTAETRTLLEEDGKPRREERAELKTDRFGHKLVVYGPVGLLGEAAQGLHDYVVARETEMEGEPVLIIDVRPKGMGSGSLYGKAWVRPRDGAVLRIEWEPGSMGNYAAIEEIAKDMRAKPKITFTSEYGLEKNGLRFPSAYEVVEAYRTSASTITASKTSVAYKDYKFFEVKVNTVVRRGG
jgi:VWFA-related protein